MHRRLLLIFSLIFLLLALGGCGSGSDESSRSRKVSIKTSGLIPPGLTIGAIQMTLRIPAGVYVRTETNPASPSYGEPLPGVVTLVGGNPARETIAAQYTPATGTTPGQLKFIATNVDGFASGEYLLLDLDVSQGATPVAADFSITYFVVSDLTSYNTIPVTDPTLTVQIY